MFTAQADDGALLDAEACERLFSLSAQVRNGPIASPPEGVTANVKRQLDAALSRALQENDQYFQREREKLDLWAEDQIKAAEQTLEDTKIRIRVAKRRARVAASVEEQKKIQNEIKQLESNQRRQRQQIFEVEDEIESRRDALIDALEKRLHQRSRSHRLFRVRWQLV